jgi:MtfA peptidase
MAPRTKKSAVRKALVHPELDGVWERGSVPDLTLIPACLDSDLYRRLTHPQRSLCDVRIRKFLAVVEILGVLNHVVTVREAVRVAFSCALLFAGRPDWNFPPGVKIRVSPVPFDKQFVPCPQGTYGGFVSPRTSELWLSTRDTALSFKETEGFHVPIHEFAHVLDHGVLGHTRKPDGVPGVVGVEGRRAWVEALERARLRAGTPADRPLLSAYAATKLCETFACSLEVFFERPREFRAWDAELYRLIADFLQQDPAAVR